MMTTPLASALAMMRAARQGRLGLDYAQHNAEPTC